MGIKIDNLPTYLQTPNPHFEAITVCNVNQRKHKNTIEATAERHAVFRGYFMNALQAVSIAPNISIDKHEYTEFLRQTLKKSRNVSVFTVTKPKVVTTTFMCNLRAFIQACVSVASPNTRILLVTSHGLLS